MPQIEVTFDIDANGILHVSAKDKATGKEQSITIKASSGLSDEEVDRMVKDAEIHAEEDRKFHELINARNQADSMIHATEKSMGELGDKLEEEEKTKIEAAISDLKKALEGEDKDDIEAKTTALTESSAKMAERLYAEKAEGANPEGFTAAAEAAAAGGDTGSQEGSSSGGSDDAMDAEFEEVKDK